MDIRIDIHFCKLSIHYFNYDMSLLWKKLCELFCKLRSSLCKNIINFVCMSDLCCFMVIFDQLFDSFSTHFFVQHRVGGNRNRNIQLTNADQKPIETVFLIAIYRHCGDKWQSKTLFLTMFDPRSSIVLAFWIATYPVCVVFQKNDVQSTLEKWYCQIPSTL